MVCWVEPRRWQRLTCRSTRAATRPTSKWHSNSRWINLEFIFTIVIYAQQFFLFLSFLLKHDVMYHHGMGGPPQRPLQVRNFCLIIVDRRTKLSYLSPFDRCCWKLSCVRERNEAIKRHSGRLRANAISELNNFTNNWTLDRRDCSNKFEFRGSLRNDGHVLRFGHVPTLGRDEQL